MLHQNKILDLLSKFEPEYLQHLSVSPTPDGEGVVLRWHVHRQAPVPIPALELLAVTGHGMAAALPPAAASEAGDNDTVMSEEGLPYAEGGDEYDDDDQGSRYGDIKTEPGDDDDDRRSRTPVPFRYATEPVEGAYDAARTTRGRSVDVEAANAEQAVRAYPQLVAHGSFVHERWAMAEQAGVFSGAPAPAPAPAPNSTGPNSSGPEGRSAAARDFQARMGYSYAAAGPSQQAQHQPQQPQQPQQQQQHQFPPLLGGTVVRRCLPPSQAQRPRTSSPHSPSSFTHTD